LDAEAEELSMWTTSTPVDTTTEEARAIWRDIYTSKFNQYHDHTQARESADDAMDAFLAAAGKAKGASAGSKP
jgi:hypothetical protein